MATMSVSYLTIDGDVIAEDRQGVQSDYVPDSLGSTVALFGPGQEITDTWDYWPYGETRIHNGSSDTSFTYVGTLGYCQDAADDQYYVIIRILKAALARWLTQAPMEEVLRGEHPYGYGEGNPILHTDPSGRNVYLCTRTLRDRDFLPWWPWNTKDVAEHWWIVMDKPGPCQNTGYGPGTGPAGHYGAAQNMGAGYPSDVTCTLMSRDPAVETCIADLAAKVASGAALCGSTWTDGPTCHTYNFLTHNCQDYTVCLLHNCSTGNPYWARYWGWEGMLQGFPFYWPLVRKGPIR